MTEKLRLTAHRRTMELGTSRAPRPIMLETWGDVIDFLQARGGEMIDGGCELVWPIEGVSVIQIIRPMIANTRGWLLITAPVVDTSMSSDGALAYNATLAIGALAHDNGELVVRHVLAFPTDNDTFEQALTMVALEAGTVRLPRERADASPFIHFTE